MKEIWKDIPGYEGIYQASNMGAIRTSENKTTYTERHGVRHWKQRMLHFQTDNGGHHVTLYKAGKPKKWLVHRLVAITFLGFPEEEGLTVNHRDGNRRNNKIENLEWLTRADNIRHGFRTGLYPTKAIALVGESGCQINFRSFSEASGFLSRYPKYVSDRIRKGCDVFYDNFGNEYRRVSCR